MYCTISTTVVLKVYRCKKILYKYDKTAMLLAETGRWARPASVTINERKCTFCNALEDEFHFVLQCRLYSQLRTQYIPICYWISPNMFKFIELMNTENLSLIRKLYIFQKHS
jgi:hypothetical protein